METTIDVITKITYIFFIFLLMAVFVERTVEILVSFYNYFEFQFNGHEKWNKRAEKYRSKFDNMFKYSATEPSKNNILNWMLWGIITEPSYTEGKYIISAQSIKTRFLQVYSKIFANGIALGLILILYYKYETSFVDVVLKVLPKTPTLAFFETHAVVNIIISSVVVASGVAPLHGFINRIEKIGQKKNQTTKA